MDLNSIISIVARSENAKDRRLAIQNSWSEEETIERHRVAIESQLRLAAIISMENHKTSRFKRVLEMAS